MLSSITAALAADRQRALRQAAADHRVARTARSARRARRGLPGRSKMGRAELAKALRHK